MEGRQKKKTGKREGKRENKEKLVGGRKTRRNERLTREIKTVKPREREGA